MKDHPRPEIVGNFGVVYPIYRDDLAEAVLTPLEFCPQCGAGIGKHRRPGEGTCPQCDPEGVKVKTLAVGTPKEKA